VKFEEEVLESSHWCTKAEMEGKISIFDNAYLQTVGMPESQFVRCVAVGDKR
jgi:hypothetical protein